MIVPLHKGKGSKSKCNSYGEISLLSVLGKDYGKLLKGRVMELMKKVGEELGGFREGKRMC